MAFTDAEYTVAKGRVTLKEAGYLFVADLYAVPGEDAYTLPEGEYMASQPNEDHTFTSQYTGVQYIDADSENDIKGAVFVFKPSAEGGNQKQIKLRGLDRIKKYKLEFEDNSSQNITLTGNYLMNNGLSVTLKDDVDSEIIWIKEA